MGLESSATRQDLLRVAERIIDEEGVAAVTARRLAEALGLKRQIVHYYFRSIDDVIIGVIRAKGERYKGGLERALAQGNPLHVIWMFSGDPVANAAVLEFSALAIRRDRIRVELARLTELYREILAQALAAELDRRGIKLPHSIQSLVMMIGGISRSLAVESAVGVQLGHDEAASLVEAMIQAYLGSPDLTVRPSPAEAQRAAKDMDSISTAKPRPSE